MIHCTMFIVTVMQYSLTADVGRRGRQRQYRALVEGYCGGPLLSCNNQSIVHQGTQQQRDTSLDSLSVQQAGNGECRTGYWQLLLVTETEPVHTSEAGIYLKP